MLIESEIKNLQVKQLEKGGLIFGVSQGLIHAKLEELYGEKLYSWPSNQTQIYIDELTGKTVFIPSYLTHTVQSEIQQLLTNRQTSGINLVITIPSLESINPLFSQNEIEDKIAYAIANLQTVLFTRCHQKLADYLSSKFHLKATHLTNIPWWSFKAEAPERLSVLAS